MITPPCIRQFLPENASLTALTQGLFICPKPPSSEQVSTAIAKKLRSFLITIADSCSRRPEGYTITTTNGDIEPPFMEGFLIRLATDLRTPIESDPCKIAEMGVLLKQELVRLATTNNLDLPRGRLAVDDNGMISVFSTEQPEPENEPDPDFVRAKVVRRFLLKPD